MKHKLVTIAPFFMLFITALSSYLSTFDNYNSIFIYLGDLVGYSIVTNLVFMFLYFRKKFCIQTKIAVLGLLIMNVVSIVCISNDIIYDYTYDLWITLIIFAIIIISLLK